MICYSPKPQSEYMVSLSSPKPKLLKKFSMGLGDPDIVETPAIWNYAVVTSKLPFMWEDKKVPMKQKPSEFPHFPAILMDMPRRIGSFRVEEAVSELGPEQFLELCKNNPVSHLEMSKFHGGESNFRLVVMSRVYAWKKINTPEEKAILAMVKRQI